MDLSIRSSRRRFGATGFNRLAIWLTWPLRVLAARRTLRQLGRLDAHELKDIGLSRQDLADATALTLDQDPSLLLARRAGERRRRA